MKQLNRDRSILEHIVAYTVKIEHFAYLRSKRKIDTVLTEQVLAACSFFMMDGGGIHDA